MLSALGASFLLGPFSGCQQVQKKNGQIAAARDRTNIVLPLGFGLDSYASEAQTDGDVKSASGQPVVLCVAEFALRDRIALIS